jgi:hypothetical protein
MMHGKRKRDRLMQEWRVERGCVLGWGQTACRRNSGLCIPNSANCVMFLQVGQHCRGLLCSCNSKLSWPQHSRPGSC